MRKVRKTLPIVIPAFAILGILAVSSHAKKPTPPPEPTVTVTGAIEGTGNPKAIRITFVDSELVAVYPDRSPCWFISNPDYPPSLKIINSAPPCKHLRYYYCTGDHNENDLICTNPSHDPDDYYCLTISDGITQKKNPNDTDHVFFPAGRPWQISWKKDNSIVASGTIGIDTTYILSK
jgi:hypothetical protein